MATAGRVASVGTLVVVLAAAGYATADAYDVVPGVVTLAPPVPDPLPFPTAPGAVEPPPVQRALGDLDPQVPLPEAGQLQALVDALAADARLGPHVGVTVVDQLTGEVLASHAPDEGLVPASTAKVVTGIAALTALDPGAMACTWSTTCAVASLPSRPSAATRTTSAGARCRSSSAPAARSARRA